jgi:hypothetical protein
VRGLSFCVKQSESAESLNVVYLFGSLSFVVAVNVGATPCGRPSREILNCISDTFIRTLTAKTKKPYTFIYRYMAFLWKGDTAAANWKTTTAY